MSSSPDLRLRPLEAGDLDAVHAIEVAAAPDPWSRDLLAGELADDRHDRLWLVAVDLGSAMTEPDAHPEPDGGIIGFGGVLQVVDEAHIMNMAVDPSWRRRGVASRLLAALLVGVGDRGAISATLEVRSGNRAAFELYRRFGFESAGRRPGYYPDGEDAEIMWCHRIDRSRHRDRFLAVAAGEAMIGPGAP